MEQAVRRKYTAEPKREAVVLILAQEARQGPYPPLGSWQPVLQR